MTRNDRNPTMTAPPDTGDGGEPTSPPHLVGNRRPARRRGVPIVATLTVVAALAAGCTSTSSAGGPSTAHLSTQGPSTANSSAGGGPTAAEPPSPDPASSTASTSSSPGEPSSTRPSSTIARVPAPGFAAPRPADVDQRDASAVAIAAAVALSAADTDLDASPNGTARRASAWLTPAMAATVTSAPAVSAPGAQWDLWASHHAYLTATAVPARDSGAPPDSAAIAYRQVAVTTTAHGRDGWADQPVTHILFLTLNTIGTPSTIDTSGGSSGWRVAAVQGG